MNKARQAYSYSNILRIAVPLMVSGLSLTLVNLTDTIFLSQLGTAELGGAGNAVLLFTVFMELGLGFATGSEIILARRNGQRKYHLIGAIVQHSLLFMALFSLLVMATLWWVLPHLTPSIVQDDSIRTVMQTYLDSRAWGILFSSVNVVFIAYFVGITKTRVIGIVTPITAIINIILDYGLIFGNFGLPELGVEGAAWASNLAELVATLIYAFYTFKVFDHRPYKLFESHGLSAARFANLFRISWPVMVQNFVALAAWFIFFSFIEHLGKDELAASHIVRSIYMVLIIPVFGLGDTTNSLTSNFLGENKSEHVWKLIRNANVIGLVYCLILQPLFYVGGRWLFYPFTDNELIIDMGMPAMQVIFTALMLFSGVIVGFRALSGTGKTLVGLLIEGITVAIYLIFAWWIATLPGVKLHYVWMAEFLYFVVFILLVYPYLIWGKWRESNV